jgi:hypothetical protein
MKKFVFLVLHMGQCLLACGMPHKSFLISQFYYEICQGAFDVLGTKMHQVRTKWVLGLSQKAYWVNAWVIDYE